MAKITAVQQNFSAGQVSEKLLSRINLDVYYNSVQRMINFIGDPQGQARFSDGTMYAANSSANNKARLIRFQFNTEQAYMIELTDQRARFFKDNAIMTESAQSITNITTASPGVFTITGHGYSNGDEVYLSGVTGQTSLNGKFYIIANSTTNTFELTDFDGNAINITTASSGGTAARVVALTTPWVEADLFQLKTAQTNDTLYITHPSYAPRTITRTSATSFSISTPTFTGTFTFASTDNYPRSVAFHEQRLVFGGTNNDPQKLFFSVSASYTDFTTGTGADDAMSFVIASKEVNQINWLASASNFLVAGTFGAEFIVKGGSDDDAITPTSINVRPVSFNGVDDQEPVLLDNHILYTQRDKQTVRSFEFDALQDSFVSVNRTLLSDEIANSNIVQMGYQQGRPSIVYCVLGNGNMAGMVFEPREKVSGWHVYDREYDIESVATIYEASGPDQVWVSGKLTIGANTHRHIDYMATQPTVPKLFDYFTGAANRDSDDAAWRLAMFEVQKQLIFMDSALTLDGSDQSVTMDPAAAATTVGSTGVTFTAGGSLFSSDDVGRQIWAKDKLGRAKITTYNSATEVECTILVAFEDADSMAAGSWYLTSNEISNLDHLEGKEVAVLTDGGVVEDLSVSSGSITLPNDQQASVVSVGLGYNGTIVSNDIEAGGQNGPAQTKPKNINQLGFRFLNTLGAMFGTDIYDLEKIEFRSSDDLTDRPPPLFSGIKTEPMTDDWSEQKQFIVRQERPLPCIIQSVVAYMETNDT